MRNLIIIYRDVVARAVLGTRPAILAKEADTAALERICHTLADAEVAKSLLCSKGYGSPSQTLTELVRALPQQVQA